MMYTPGTSVNYAFPLFVEYGLPSSNEKAPRIEGRVKVYNMTQAQELKRVFTEQGFYVDIVYRLRYRFNNYYFTLEALEELVTLASDVINADWSYERDRPSVKSVPKKIVD